ncbi:MAG TPA: YdcF family protein [Thermoleophilia bacterium]|nr:YdcF family protein [Thermoleophilia bacterium]
MAAVARGLALFFGAFTLLNVVGALRTPGFDANIWWIDLHLLPQAAALVFLVAAALALIGYAARPRMSRWRSAATLVLAGLCAVATAWNGVDFYILWGRGDFHPGMPLPLSFVLCAGFAFIFWAALRPPPAGRRRLPAAAVLAVTAAACVVLFPLAQEFFFGNTDYLGGSASRPADAVVVFGAEVHADGSPSFVLMDRMDTAIRLYRDHRVKRIIVSGAVGVSGYNEALVMRDMAVKAGVPHKDVVVDSAGVNTEATVRDTVPFFGGVGWRRIAAESDFYHLPRIKLAYARAGWNVLTVPAQSTHRIPQTPFLVLREVPAFWVYYLRAIGG